ncbi:hypothetical protein PHYBLDRAFT_59500 [Phycomyces blakesleeanus NRRL 1555(-)]|uniref:Helitron helicase-like domain-containing protein n=1 Tax=Phycomyces blakesleeanus (strain ATCC 8743b / DSM 1359 / FGSC 10004 / NBRC 33097 / NRRL 1555) TaxID=763407 RepID=A0A167NIA0_PHYB8|nr:hypothetical protein PHYBLDRAFT_59500 [Phycomyces blakesleeanus NRRL 1555(-)]OAD75969.1 hypothetical protein PHYBLDRAFT_59500 [Phycomyces blakesleeanus NRRL 1555(-)]|eukprot:XP_018294009.1 hypothetical protein PHYBLDRAFT_59500 [Phycomyces blakesleeanus NRRL 1555(-)]
MSSTQRCCAACHMLRHSRSTHKQCLINPKNISLHIPQKRANVDEYPAESSRTAALRIRSEPVQDQNLDIETSTSISVSELTEFPLANETITEVLEAVMEEEIEETSSDEEMTGREEEVKEISTVNRGSILPHCPHCNGTDHCQITSRFCSNNNSSRARGSRNRGRDLNNIARLPAISEPAVDNSGDMDIECQFCGAMIRSSLRSRTFSMCCNKEKHVLPQIEPTPTGIAELLNYRTRDGKKFLENIRSYNSTMSFTSLGAKIDTSVGNNINGAYNFWIHGTICHRIGSILPVTESDVAYLKFAQIYIYDSAAQIDQRQYHSPQLERSVLEKIQSILMETNPFVHLFRTMDQISWEKGQSIDLTLCLVAEGPRDQRRYNAPTASEIAVLIMNNEESTSRDIVLHTRANFQQSINDEDGWTIDASSLSEEHVTHLLHLFGRLFQQYIVDMYAKVEHDRLHFITSNQNRLRVDLYSGIQDAVIHNDCNLANLGKRVILPSSFIGSPRYMAQLYQDSMSIVRRFGKSDLFITFTCNSKWPEITNSLLAGQKANDRPDLCSRAFNMKLKELMIDLTKKIFWGKFWPLYMSLNFKSADFLMPTFI